MAVSRGRQEFEGPGPKQVRAFSSLDPDSSSGTVPNLFPAGISDDEAQARATSSFTTPRRARRRADCSICAGPSAGTEGTHKTGGQPGNHRRQIGGDACPFWVQGRLRAVSRNTR